MMVVMDVGDGMVDARGYRVVYKYGTARVFIGRLPNEATERDLEHFFRHYGRVKDVSLKLGYAFVDLESSRDAEEAVHGLNNKQLCGYRVNVELSKSRAPTGGYSSGSGPYRGESHSSYRSDRYGGRGRDYEERGEGEFF
uniref:RRM domain-containing protein n=1 Tax=Ditylenchus dipsaci TaxID=166011 RepID=A0A915ELH7_9BILA